MKLLRCALVLFLLIHLSACSGLLFFPTKEWVQTPDQYGYPYQAVEIIAKDDLKLSAWLMRHRTPTLKGAFIFFHGNAENISTHVNQVYWLTDQGFDVLLVDYRGYGKSEGNPGLTDSLDDIAVSLKWFVERYPDNTAKYMLGQSLGASMSGYVIATTPDIRQQFSGIVLDSGFTNYRRITREVMARHWSSWILQYPAAWSMPDKFNLDGVISNISPTPLLIVHGTQDVVIPFKHAQDLYKAARAPKNILQFEGPHIGAFNNKANREMLIQWVKQAALNNSSQTQ